MIYKERSATGKNILSFLLPSNENYPFLIVTGIQ